MIFNRFSFTRLVLVLAVVFPLGGCKLLEPIIQARSGPIAERALDRPIELQQLAARNRSLRQDQPEAAMQQPPRPDSGLIGEIDVSKAVHNSIHEKAKSNEKASRIRLDFENISLRTVIAAFMSDYIKLPYSFQENFRDRNVNLVFDAMATREEVISLFESLLHANGVRLRKNGSVYLIGSSDEKASEEKGSSSGGNIGSGQALGESIGLFKLKFIESKDFVGLAKQVVQNADKITQLPGNILMLNTSQADIRAIDTLLKDVDVPAFLGKHVLVYSPRYLSAAGLVAILDSYQNQLTAGSPANVKQFEVKQIPDMERVVIVAANKVARDLVHQFLAQADVLKGNDRQIFHYPLSMQTATDLAPNLLTLLKSVLRNASEINVVADKTGNSLLIYASPSEYAEIKKLLNRLDQRPPSVQIDVAIAEVRLNNSMRYGVEWYLKSTGNLVSDIATTLIPTDFTSPALATGIIDSKNNFATLQLLASETSFSLLSNPKIVVRNGATAKINVGSEEPIPKGKLISGTSTQTAVEVEFKKIGLELEVTPWVTNNNEVRIVIKVKDDTITGTKLIDGNSYPILSNRQLTTDLVATDGSTIFMGGLRRQNSEDGMVKVPGAADVPYLGALFRNKKIDDNGTELIILATPHLILDQQGADIILNSLMRAANEKFVDLRPPKPIPPTESMGATTSRVDEAAVAQ